MGDFLFLIFGSILSALICMLLAKWKERPVWNWGLWGALLGIVGIIIILFLPKLRKTCHYCAEKIKMEATKCKHCSSDIPEDNFE